MISIRSRRRLRHSLKLFAMAVGFIVVCAFIPPARNLIGYFFLPGPWRPLSSFKIIQLYFADPQYPVEETEVTCDDIQETMSRVQWQKIVAEMDTSPVYDQSYFDHLKAHADEYGTSDSDFNGLEKRYYRFKPSMTRQWQREMYTTFKVFAHVMEVFKVPFFLCEGSMLGSYRHHGFIPWDDDMDVCMNGTDWLKVKKILRCLPDFGVSVEDQMMYKFFWNHSPLWTRQDYIRYPFIDIFFFNEDKDYIWAITPFKKNRIVFLKSDVFPLTYRPYEGLVVPVPKNIDKICTIVYDPTICVSRDFDHLNRHFLPFYEVEYIPCHTFRRIYPFVVRQEMVIKERKATVEYRKIGRKIISNYTIFH